MLLTEDLNLLEILAVDRLNHLLWLRKPLKSLIAIKRLQDANIVYELKLIAFL